ncbi:MAG: aconitate hydratase [bacterium]|nr:aconitate hydratase [bacterium]
MPKTLALKLIEAHRVEGELVAGQEIGLKIDQTLTQDATGTLVMLQYDALDLGSVQTEVSVQYVDHNLIQGDFRNADDHLFLQSACRKFGVVYSKPGNGVSHPVHMERFGRPGASLLGSDSHSCAAGSLGMLAMGAGGLEVALAMAGRPFYVKMPQIFGIKLTGSLPDWVSAKDVILEMLRRHGVKGGVGKIIEYYGPGVAHLSAMDRHVIANMGAELGATATVFPSDHRTLHYLKQQGRASQWQAWAADEGAVYDLNDEIDLCQLEPLIALPSSPGNVVTVAEVAGRPIGQAYIGSSANPGLRDFAIVSMIVAGSQVSEEVSFDINPSSRQVLENLIQLGHLEPLIHAGARLHQAGCNGCIGMGQAPATDRISLRTVPRNFAGRSGTPEDQVYLCSPETAAASALTGVITDPRSLKMAYPRFEEPEELKLNLNMLSYPKESAQPVQLIKGPNIADLPHFEGIADRLELPILLKTGDDISTDEILPAGAEVLPYRSNIPEISRFVFRALDPGYVERALKHQMQGSVIAGGANYGQGSSREHAALAPRFLGVKVLVALSFARIHWQNLVNFGILPLTFENPEDYQKLQQGDVLLFEGLHQAVKGEGPVRAHCPRLGTWVQLRHLLTSRQREMILAGGLINWTREQAEFGAA